MPYMDPMGDFETSGEFFISYIHLIGCIPYGQEEKSTPQCSLSMLCSNINYLLETWNSPKKNTYNIHAGVFSKSQLLGKNFPNPNNLKKKSAKPTHPLKAVFFRANRASPQALSPWRCCKLNLLHGFFNQTNLIARQHFGLMQPEGRFRTPRFNHGMYGGVLGGMNANY